jgi:hypothetical protein
MINQGNVLPPAGGKDIKRYDSYGSNHPKYTSDGVPTTEPMGDEGLSIPMGKSKPTFQLNVRPIGDAPGQKPDPRKGTMLPESDDALDQYAKIEHANLSQGVFEHEVNVEIPWEGFNDPANLKV